MIESDYKFWQKAAEYWHGMAQMYLDLGMGEDATRCIERADLSVNRRMEAAGEILSYGPEIYVRGA